MKNKARTYVLLATVLLVWGMIGYRIISTLNPPETKLTERDLEVSFIPRAPIKVDTFSIQTVDRDPFLGTLLVKKKVVAKTPREEDMVWKPILYHGNIAKNGTNKKVFIISISGQQHVMKIGQTIDGVQLISGNSSTVTVSYKGHRKTCTKS